MVLVGHSYGGSVITEAGNHPNVAALVYIAAFALDEGESCASIEQALPQASKAFTPDSNGNWWIEQEHFAADFAADIPLQPNTRQNKPTAAGARCAALMKRRRSAALRYFLAAVGP